MGAPLSHFPLLTVHPGMRAWEDFAQCSTAVPYVPTDAEMSYGALVMQQWQSLAKFGSIPGESFYFAPSTHPVQLGPACSP